MPLWLSGIRRQGAVGAIATFLALFVINRLLRMPMGRAWEYWTTRLAKAGEMPTRAA